MQEKIGARLLRPSRCAFRVWAPAASSVELIIDSDAPSPQARVIPLAPAGEGYFSAEVDDAPAGTRYRYRLDGTKERPDPASRCQPQGVHGPSQVIDHDFAWSDTGWTGLPLKDCVFYELHVGTYTSEGTFDAIVGHLAALKDLGVTAIELMPVAQFPGERNWGYDGVQPFAVQHSYGGAQGLKRLVDACHQRGLAVVLDVVYNHLGPEGNYLADFGPYFTERYKTPWGWAVNFDGPDSDPVRRYFIDNALYWVEEFHIDALRLDAVHAILDHSPFTFLEQLAEEVHAAARTLGRTVVLVVESAANDARLIRSRTLGGYGFDGQWNDDFHHALRGVLTGEHDGYYMDYGELSQLAKAFREGFVYSGEYSQYRRHRHGTSTRDLPGERFVVFAQNHDHVGNRMLGERLGQLVDFATLKLAAASVILSPCVPLLFMGEEYGEAAPFQYFISHSDHDLIEAVRRGRREEFAAFRWQGEPPDPQDPATFLRAKLNHSLKHEGRHHVLWRYYRELLRLRRTLGPLTMLDKEHCEVVELAAQQVLVLRRHSGQETALVLLNYHTAAQPVPVPIAPGHWRKVLDSNDTDWAGPGSALPAKLTGADPVALQLPPRSAVLYLATG